MRTKAFLVVCAAVAIVGAAGADAQTPARFEIGGQVAVLRTGNVANLFTPATEVGGGGRLAWQFSRQARFEGEVDVIPRDAGDRGTQTLALFGVVAGYRGRALGLFGKVRAGVIRYAHPTPVAHLLGGTSFDATNPAVDLGGVIEAYPTQRFIFRVDAGDTLVRLGGICRAVLGECPTTATQHNLQVNAGIGWRF